METATEEITRRGMRVIATLALSFQQLQVLRDEYTGSDRQAVLSQLNAIEGLTEAMWSVLQRRFEQPPAPEAEADYKRLKDYLGEEADEV